MFAPMDRGRNDRPFMDAAAGRIHLVAEKLISSDGRLLNRAVHYP